LKGRPDPVIWDPCPHLEPPARRRLRNQFAAAQGDAFAHPDQTEAGPDAIRLGCRPVSGIRDSQLEITEAEGHPHFDARGTGVLDDVRKCLLHYPVRNQIQTRRQRSRLALEAQLNGQTKRPGPVNERIQLRQSGGRGTRKLVVVSPQHADDQPQLYQRFAPRGFDNPKCDPSFLEISGGDPEGTTGLDHHHTDAVGDNVVQFSGYAIPLLRGCEVNSCLLLVPQSLGRGLKLSR
jgi:hypothetical protein